MMKSVKILDCTLRDGGYYNEWNFSSELVKGMLAALNGSGVDIVELGYRSRTKTGFYGPYKYCPESYLKWVDEFKQLKFAFMLDAKEFLTPGGQADWNAFEEMVIPSDHSIFSWCRIATSFGDSKGSIELAARAKKLGYRTCLNLMGLSLLKDAEIVEVLKRSEGAGLDVFYFADSFGGFSPEDVRRIIPFLKSHYSGKLGIHTHENQGLAFANTLVAMEQGVDFVDATITGMGRGAGNLRLEQLLLFLRLKSGRSDLNAYSLLDIIERYFVPLHRKYGWGWDYTYMLSGLSDIHPSYCQRLKSNHQFTLTQVTTILNGITREKAQKFDGEELQTKISSVTRFSPDETLSRLPEYRVPKAKHVLVVASGPLAKEHQEGIRAWIEKHRPLVIECNQTGILNGVPRVVAILNRVRLEEVQRDAGETSALEYVVGFDSVPTELVWPELKGCSVGIVAGQFKIDQKPHRELVIPGYVVGMMAVGLAFSADPTEIYLAGFDGFSGESNQDQQSEMDSFFDLATQMAISKNTKIKSLLPTRYSLPVTSLYSDL